MCMYKCASLYIPTYPRDMNMDCIYLYLYIPTQGIISSRRTKYHEGAKKALEDQPDSSDGGFSFGG